MAPGRSLHISCTTWDQVETFYQRKLRRGNLLSIKLPFSPAIGERITLGLELPNQVVIAIDGAVSKTSMIDGTTKSWVEVELLGLTSEVVARLKHSVADGRDSPRARSRDANPVPPLEALPDDERRLFLWLSTELRRLRALPVHGVLGVEFDADALAVRRGWIELVRRYHPDVLAPRRSTAISHLAEEIVIHVNRAYDRFRATLVAAGRAMALGSALFPPRGWLLGFEDLDGSPLPLSSGVAERRRRRSSSIRFMAGTTDDGGEALEPQDVVVTSEPDPPDLPIRTSGGASFEVHARTRLAEGKIEEARELLATALSVYPRSRALRSLYYVASALVALAENQTMLATSQLEAAMAQGEGSDEAAAILDLLREGAVHDQERVRKVFG